MARPRTAHPSLEALRMRAVRERARCGIKRRWLEYDDALLWEKLGDTGQWTAEEFADEDRKDDYLNQLLQEAIENL